jgi:hypothetical protein
LKQLLQLTKNMLGWGRLNRAVSMISLPIVHCIPKLAYMDAGQYFIAAYMDAGQYFIATNPTWAYTITINDNQRHI